MQDEISRRLEEVKIREESRWKEKVMRKKPVWEALAYSHEEDLHMRLQLRRDEDRLRQEEHKHRMKKMHGRVNNQPTLFERQSLVCSEYWFHIFIFHSLRFSCHMLQEPEKN